MALTGSLSRTRLPHPTVKSKAIGTWTTVGTPDLGVVGYAPALSSSVPRHARAVVVFFAKLIVAILNGTLVTAQAVVVVGIVTRGLATRSPMMYFAGPVNDKSSNWSLLPLRNLEDF
jgi:hypothetical protein